MTKELFYSRSEPDEPDEQISAFMAASFTARLSELYGFEAVSGFCFGKKSFEEATGREIKTEFEEWRSWILERYPLE